MAANELNWLHLSDLHVGQSSLSWLWPNYKTVFFKDLQRTFNDLGGFDLIIFSGDLTQKGSVEEYDALSSILGSLYEHFDKWGKKPLFFSVPGNHDLARPDPDAPESLLLKQWWETPQVTKGFWESDQGAYRKHVHVAFSNYLNWQRSLSSQGIPTPNLIDGLIPGDASASLLINNVSLGLIGLNSSFLHLGEGDYQGKLALDIRQLLAVTNEDVDAWCAKHDANFLITHHPSNWLAPRALTHFEEDIHVPGRFTAHLFGHMHGADMLDVARGGGLARKNIQGSSLFGLEHLRDGSTLRLHGYTAGKISKSNGTLSWQLWPKILHLAKDGARKFVANQDFALEPGKEYLTEQLTSNYNLTTNNEDIQDNDGPLVELSVNSFPETAATGSILEALRYRVQEATHHETVRIATQKACAAAMRHDRMAWICTDWGLGIDGFISSLIKTLKTEKIAIFCIDLGNYSSRAEFLEKFPQNHGSSFPEFCKYLARFGPAILLFDEAPSQYNSELAVDLAADVEQLGKMVLDFCPQIMVLAITRVKPERGGLSCLKLEPLDEADTRAYIFSHKESPPDVKNPRAINEIFGITEGVPGKIDRLLKSLRVVSLSELRGAATVSNTAVTVTDESVPRALVKAVAEIFDSADPYVRRSAVLLKLLCLLPHGESYLKVRRFDSQYPFHYLQAEELLNRGLIGVKASIGLMSNEIPSDGQLRILTVLKPVRTYVLSLLSEKEVENLSKRAMSLYFEEQKSTGRWRIKARNGINLSDDVTTLQNAHILTLRALSKAIELGSVERIRAAVIFAQLYCAELKNGKHYRSCAEACEQIISALEDVDPKIIDANYYSIKFLYAQSLRMTSELTRALIIFEELYERDWSKDLRASLLLSYALCLQSLGDTRAVSVANDVIKLSPRSHEALQAKAVILEMRDGADVDADLRKLENEARKRGATTVMNNLVLSRISDEKDKSVILTTLRDVVNNALKTNDTYTVGRATVKLSNVVRAAKTKLSNSDVKRLIQSYQYFYGQRFDSLFSEAHAALWDVFEREGDIQNLLSLFRHSSFIWRLNGTEEREKTYVKRLKKSAASIVTTDLRTADEDTAYFLVRAHMGVS